MKPSFLTKPIVCILLTETAERFAYYGFRAILILYLTQALRLKDGDAIARYSFMTSFAYCTPLLGAIVADVYLGKYLTILSFGMVYAFGLAMLTMGAYMDEEVSMDQKKSVTFGGLLFICIGTGGIKPCVSAFGADQIAGVTNHSAKDSSSINQANTRAFFSYFYFAINLGSVFSYILIPIVRAREGFGSAFLLPTIFLYVALAIFIWSRNQYIQHRPRGKGRGGNSDDSNMLETCKLFVLLLRKKIISNLVIILSRFRYRMRRIDRKQERVPLEETQNNATNSNDTSDIRGYSQHQVEEVSQIINIMPILSFFSIFWMLYNQSSSVWVLQANRMNLHGFQPEQLGVVNPILIMLFIPLFDKQIYPYLEFRKWKITHIGRMGGGMLLTAISFIMSGCLEIVISMSTKKVSVLWQLPQIINLSLAEILVSVTGSEFAYSNSPVSMKSLVMALYLVMTSLGDLIGGLLYSTIFQALKSSSSMFICALMMLTNFILFCFIARNWSSCSANNGKKQD
mmetsp:Transcript_7293/g.10436  ORF Transcript_7293/g.10436 Transcript_7293/m.10436 type:complete len:513 (-) Transcript_7293:50-1588(-)